MALSDMFKKFFRDDVPEDESEDSYYRPRKKPGAPTLVDEPDDDAFRAPKTRTGASRYARGNDYDDELGFGDEAYTGGKPRFKRVAATTIKSAEHAVDLVCQNYVVLINTEQVSDEMLTPLRCYIAGAVRALDAHITALDDENVFVSIEPFDATPYMPAQDDLAEQQDDLI